MQTQCPQCYGYDIVITKPKPVWIWLLLMAVIDAAVVFIILLGTMENLVPLIIGLVIADSLLTLPLLRAIRARSQQAGVEVYRCTSCGCTWSETGGVPDVQSPAVDGSGFIRSSGPVSSISSDGAFRMTVEDVFTIKGRGTVVTGRVESGTIAVGDAIEIHSVDGIMQTVVEGVEMFHKTVSRANVGDNVGILLRNVDKDGVHRGDILKGGKW
ncbi:MAG: hypothetical protein JXA33_22280 [Anaerolineae bacterium]|nr:hypothetical protein [Anaerolineae bacterium]